MSEMEQQVMASPQITYELIQFIWVILVPIIGWGIVHLRNAKKDLASDLSKLHRRIDRVSDRVNINKQTIETHIAVYKATNGMGEDHNGV